MIDQLGSPTTYGHYPTGWAVAFSTPFRMFKRYSYQGGVCDPLVVSWPKGIKARGEVRSQYHHSVDIFPTILEACGIAMPAVVNGYEQSPLSGISMAYTFMGDGPTRKETQYYEMLGTRGIWHRGWKAVAEHGPFIGTGRFDEDRWQLFHTDGDRSEAHDLADEHPDKVKELVDLWFKEAETNKVLPLSDLGATGEDLEKRGALEFHVPVPPSGQYIYYPGTTAVPEHSAANTKNVSFKILAEVDFSGDSEGVIVAQGSRFGGYSLYVKDGTLTYVFNFLGIPPEQRISAPAPRSGRHIVGIDFTKEGMDEHHQPRGTARLYIDEGVVAEDQLQTQLFMYALTGEGLSVGFDGGDAVSSEYTPRFEWTGGEIRKVVYDVADDAYVDVERHLAAAMARD
jgi:arylsulfatase